MSTKHMRWSFGTITGRGEGGWEEEEESQLGTAQEKESHHAIVLLDYGPCIWPV